MKRTRRRRHFIPGRFRTHVYPVYQPVYTKPSDEYKYCLQTSGRCPDAFDNKYGKSFNADLCENPSVQNFAKSLHEDCHPHTKENYSCRNNIYRNGNWSAGVL